MVGLGNPLMGDDAFGAQVIERLRTEAHDLPSQVDLINVHTDLLGQIERFPAYGQVVLVDALLLPEEDASRLGQVLILDEKVMEAWPETSPSIHQLSPLLAVRLFRRLYPCATTQIHLVGLGVNGMAFGPGSGENAGVLGAAVIAAAAGAVRELW